ncbi:hypothetical protein [Alteromonas mediterranea]|uniref:hypothetical protein n=1 Tax=Alteromonas mediterranea TaxID=314275 RepID=UPI0012DB3709|nr:hypothetical protein [Alteromonas mediterranea]
MFSLFLAYSLFASAPDGLAYSFEEDSRKRVAHSMLDSYAKYVLSARALQMNGHDISIPEDICINEASVFFSESNEKIDLLSIVIDTHDTDVKKVYEELNNDGMVSVAEYQAYLHPLIEDLSF